VIFSKTSGFSNSDGRRLDEGSDSLGPPHRNGFLGSVLCLPLLGETGYGFRASLRFSDAWPGYSYPFCLVRPCSLAHRGRHTYRILDDEHMLCITASLLFYYIPRTTGSFTELCAINLSFVKLCILGNIFLCDEAREGLLAIDMPFTWSESPAAGWSVEENYEWGERRREVWESFLCIDPSKPGSKPGRTGMQCLVNTNANFLWRKIELRRNWLDGKADKNECISVLWTLGTFKVPPILSRGVTCAFFPAVA
jgi:hypothetical protein